MRFNPDLMRALEAPSRRFQQSWREIQADHVGIRPALAQQGDHVAIAAAQIKHSAGIALDQMLYQHPLRIGGMRQAPTE